MTITQTTTWPSTGEFTPLHDIPTLGRFTGGATSYVEITTPASELIDVYLDGYDMDNTNGVLSLHRVGALS